MLVRHYTKCFTQHVYIFYLTCYLVEKIRGVDVYTFKCFSDIKKYQNINIPSHTWKMKSQIYHTKPSTILKSMLSDLSIWKPCFIEHELVKVQIWETIAKGTNKRYSQLATKALPPFFHHWLSFKLGLQKGVLVNIGALK